MPHDDPHPSSARATDPVCGMSVDPDRTAHRFEHDGTTYFFCCGRCRERFAADPGAFLRPAEAHACCGGKAAASAAAPVPAPAPGARWTCPMHPEIVQDEPGSCPLCGMALEPTVVTA